MPVPAIDLSIVISPWWSRSETKLDQCPALRLLLARPQKKILIKVDKTALLFSLFAVPLMAEWPVAAVTGLVDGLATHQYYWLRADPVVLRPGLSTVYFEAQDSFTTDPKEIQSMLEPIHRLVQEEGLILHTPHPCRGYLQLPWDLQLKTHAPDQVLAKDIAHYLPTGIQQAWCRRLFTEIQMLLHNTGRLTNALWFWGAGRLPTGSTLKWKAIWSSVLLVQGLAQLVGIDCHLPNQLGTCWQQMQSEGDYLLVLDLDDSLRLEADWFKPLLRLLQQRQLRQVRLYLNHTAYVITPASVRSFWRWCVLGL